MSLKRFQKVYYTLYLEDEYDDDGEVELWPWIEPYLRIYYDDSLDSLAIQTVKEDSSEPRVDVAEEPDTLKDCLSEHWKYEGDNPVAATVEQVVGVLRENGNIPFLSTEHMTPADCWHAGRFYTAHTASTFKEGEEVTLDDIKLIAHEALDLEAQMDEYRDLPFQDKCVCRDKQGSIVAMFPYDDDVDEAKAPWISWCLPPLDAFDSLSYAVLVKPNGADDLMVYAAFATKEQAEQWLAASYYEHTGKCVIKEIKK